MKSSFLQKDNRGRLIGGSGFSVAKKHFFIALVATVLLLIICFLFSPPHFTETNDDTIMSAFAYGYFGEPTEKLVYINIVIGFLMRFLINMLPGVPWYFLFQYVLVIISFCSLFFLILECFSKRYAVFPIAILICFFSYEFLCSMQFSKTAAVAVTAGLLQLFYAVKHSYRSPYIFGGLLALGGALFRFRVFEMTLIPMFGLGLFIGLPLLKDGEWKSLLKMCLPFLCIISLCFGAEALNKYIYNHDKEWSGFWELNALRDTLQNSLTDDDNNSGFPEYYENQEMYTALNITYGDYTLYRGSNFADPELFNKDVIETLVANKPARIIDISFLIGFANLIWKEMLRYPAFLAVCMTVIIALYCAVKRTNIMAMLLILYQTLAFICIQFYFFYRGRYLQSRIDLGLFLAIILILMIYCWKPDEFMPNKRSACVLISALLCIAAIPHYNTVIPADYEAKKAAEASEINDLIASDKEHFYFNYGVWSDMPDVTFHPWQVKETGYAKNRSSLGSWRVTTPTVQNKWLAYGVVNPYRDMINRPDIYLLCTKETYKNRVLTHIKEHYDPDAEASLVKTVEEKYLVYRIGSDSLKLDVDNAIDGSEIITYQINFHVTDNMLTAEGTVFLPGSNSFADNVYIGVVLDGNEEKLYPAVKKINSAYDDILYGQYSGFYTDKIKLSSTVSEINLYLETSNNVIYVISKYKK